MFEARKCAFFTSTTVGDETFQAKHVKLSTETCFTLLYK
jgi:hypothetical protein